MPDRDDFMRAGGTEAEADALFGAVAKPAGTRRLAEDASYSSVRAGDPHLSCCPFCAGEAEYKAIRYTGCLASGLEFPRFTCGCPACDVWIPQEPGGMWTAANGEQSREADAKMVLAAKWNRRDGAA
jgi:hypothetical protein